MRLRYDSYSYVILSVASHGLSLSQAQAVKVLACGLGFSFLQAWALKSRA